MNNINTNTYHKQNIDIFGHVFRLGLCINNINNNYYIENHGGGLGSQGCENRF